ncbi:MAG: hypothetical protein WBI65_01045 [Dethiobacteria bacterium]
MTEVIGMLLAIAVLIYLTYKGVDALITSLVAAAIIIVTNSMNIWEGIGTHYASSFAAFVGAYMFVIIPGALFGQIMQETGCAQSIAYKISEVVGSKRAILATVIMAAVLTYGGISGFVIVFTIFPIQKYLFEKAGLPKSLYQGTVLVGMIAGSSLIPYSPEIYNVMPTQYLGTTVASAPLFGISIAVVVTVVNMMYLKYEERKHFKLHPFVETNSDDISELSDKKGVSFIAAIIPMVVVIGTIVVTTGKLDPTDSVFLALVMGCVFAIAFGWKEIRGGVVKACSAGLKNGSVALITVSAMIGFSGVVTAAPAFQKFVDIVISFKFNPYLSEVIGLNIIAGITGSGTAGLKIFFETLGQHYLDLGANAGAMHRLSQIAGMGLNTLPHAPPVIMGLTYMGISFEEGYKATFVTSVVVTTIASILAALVATLIYPLG